MNILQSKHIHRFFLFLLCFLSLSALFQMLFYFAVDNYYQLSFSQYKLCLQDALVREDINQNLITQALNHTSVSAPDNIPHFYSYLYIFVFLFLTIFLLAGSYLFFRKEDSVCLNAEGIIRGYLEGDFSKYLPQTQEGTIFRIFSAVDQLAKSLQAKNDSIEQTKIFLKNTISDISHQLKTPLAALMMYQEIIENEPENVETVILFCSKMKTSLKRMEQLIQSMLKITRLDTGNILFEKKRYSIVDLVDCSISELTERAKKNSISISLDLDSKQTLNCDHDWTCEAIENIVKNALDHTKDGGIIQIRFQETPTMKQLIISDNGSGISPEDIHHVFKRFYRSKNSLDTPGIGLGLSLAKSIIEGQGGMISVTSKEGVGTVFTLSFLTDL